MKWCSLNNIIAMAISAWNTDMTGTPFLTQAASAPERPEEQDQAGSESLSAKLPLLNHDMNDDVCGKKVKDVAMEEK